MAKHSHDSGLSRNRRKSQENTVVTERLLGPRGGKEAVFTEKEGIVEPPQESLKTKPGFPGFDRGELLLHFLVEEAKRSLKNHKLDKSKKESY